MANGNGRYIDLLCSLPYLENPFVRKRPPITAIQLRKRFNMLDFESRTLLKKLATTFYWGQIAFDDSDEKLVRQANRLMDELGSSDIREWQMWRMDMRTIMSALRRRKQGQSAPQQNTVWGYGHYVGHIVNNWSHPTFKLESRFPWLIDARERLESGDSYGLERHLLSTEWHYYSRIQPDEQYSLSDVWLYAMKWDLVDRWCRYNAEVAKQHFEQLVQNGLKTPLEELRVMS
ncbi:DUF2764 family protein [Alkalimarinus sediminis]|uniref:DUF2764 family protein n=1 Tax=Alkalimarinus sediminis TaxID=1632866 RepID=A0A9E8HHR4_9ALTE|nr:DUF2764 family protein [Alkalimarinus sediminis]UZW74895.1 DUF2764 family protein [Alkalimarinus sediminis]